MPRPGGRLSLVALAAILVAAHACATTGAGSAPPRALSPILAAYHRESASFYPITASEGGNRRFDSVLANDISDEYRRGLNELCTRYHAEASRLDPRPLPENDRLTRELFLHLMEQRLEDLKYPWYLMPVSQIGGWPHAFPTFGGGRGVHPFKTVRNYDDFLGRVDGFVAWVDTAIVNMRTGMGRGLTQPRAVIVKLIPQLEAQIVDDPTASAFYEPIRRIPGDFDAASRARLEATYRDAIAQKIVPTYRKLLQFVRDEYVPATRTSFGLAELPGGADWYAYQVRRATTTSMTPDEVYALGLSEVKRLDAEIAAVRKLIDDTRIEPPPQYRDIDELVRAYGALRESVEAGLPKLFGRFPRAGFEIRAIEAYREASYPSSYQSSSLDGSRPGVFYLNAAEVRGGGAARVSRSLFLHEAVPGHHLQLALQRENTALPGFRRFAGYVAFVEGWALYAEGLGHELGMYGSPHDRLGALFSERFRAHRLVVDVGLHAKGWSRERAIAYLGGGPGAEREVDRYMAWPGQALGYKIGQLRILALRRKAEAAHGAAFDVRSFHDEILKDGAMPLSILEARMDRWIASRARRATRGPG
jgi:uncharacterized protein (DUF885 family)